MRCLTTIGGRKLGHLPHDRMEDISHLLLKLDNPNDTHIKYKLSRECIKKKYIVNYELLQTFLLFLFRSMRQEN